MSITLSNLPNETSTTSIIPSSTIPSFFERFPRFSNRFGKKFNGFKKALPIIIAILIVITCLYLFICTLSLLSSAFRLLGGKQVENLFKEGQFFENPLACVGAGLLGTILVQSSSTFTSIVVTMVATRYIPFEKSAYIIMGSNIGTTVTNTIVSMTHIKSTKEEFALAFSCGCIQDVFNILTTIIILPIQYFSGFLTKTAVAIVDGMNLQKRNIVSFDILKHITSPFVNSIVRIDKLKITNNEQSILADCNENPCKYLFYKTKLNDQQIGGILLVLSLIFLTLSLIIMVKSLSYLLKGRTAVVISRVVNGNLPYPLKWFTGYVALLTGFCFTIILQSSSVFTSLLVPLVALKVVSLERVYPLTLGSNIGTTFTGIIASFATDNVSEALKVSLCHVFFNIYGVILFYVIPFTRSIPIRISFYIGDRSGQYRWFSLVYLIITFLLCPLILIGLSFAGWQYLVSFIVLVLTTIFTIVIINCMQKKCPAKLPIVLRNWHFVPKWLKSLEPYDHFLGDKIDRIKLIFKKKNIKTQSVP